MSGPVGRFAPSPSGRLHLGNLACSLLAWLSAKSQGGRIVLRIEDLDAARCPRVYADQLEEDLRWLGLVWDEGGSDGGPNGPYYQSECAPIYLESYHKLEHETSYDGLSSKEIEVKKCERMFKEVGGMKNARRFAKEQRKRK